MKKSDGIILGGGTVLLILIAIFLQYLAPSFLKENYISDNKENSSIEKAWQLALVSDSDLASTSNRLVANHISTPSSVKAVYMSSWVAGTPSIRSRLLKAIDGTEINAVIIDIKDYTGKISFKVQDSELKTYAADEARIPDIESFIDSLHKRNLYVIGRIASFQDPYMAKHSPELAVKRRSDNGTWQDRKGITWIDAGAEADWQYLKLIGQESYSRGFDEVNYDYIRFPTDGNMQDIAYPFSEADQKHIVIRNFLAYLHNNLNSFSNSSSSDSIHIPFSVDLFGLTTTAKGDMGIGQEIEDALLYADFVSPMVYPSHFASGYIGFKNPGEHPYEVIKHSMQAAVLRAQNVAGTSSEPLSQKLRPWLQDFNLGAVYTPDMVRAQIQATYDAGLTSWMLWNAGNVYSIKALEAKSQ